MFKGSSKEREFDEILVDRLLHDKPISLIEKRKFHLAEFPDVMEKCAEALKIQDYKFPNSVPEVVAKINEKAPHFFSQVAPRSEFFVYKHSKQNVSASELTPEDKRNNMETKRRFNMELSNEIPFTKKFEHFGTDYDVVDSKAVTIEEGEVRDIHLNIGNMLMDSFKIAVENNSDVRIFMRAFNKDNSPFAVSTAKRLLEAGVRVLSWDEGEKHGTYVTGKLNSLWKETLEKEIGESQPNLDNLSDVTGVGKDSVKKIISGEKIPTFLQAQAIEDYFSNRYPLVEEHFNVITIYREFPSGTPSSQFQPGGTQFHKFYCAGIIRGYPSAYHTMHDYAIDVRPLAREVKLEDGEVKLA